MENSYNKDYLTLEESIELIPLVIILVESKYESNFRCCVKMVCMLFDMYSDSIRAIKRSQKIEVKNMKIILSFLILFLKLKLLLKEI